MRFSKRFLYCCFACAVLSSAFLSFQIQPIAGRLLLPVYGGAPAVWSTCLLFFQTTLFVGYAYAHLISSRLGARSQIAVHLAVIGAALVTLPLQGSIDSERVSRLPPVCEILLFLSAGIGPVFLALSATNPLVQSWWARCGDKPHRFYSLSNAGSLFALVSYPFLIEPNWPLDVQVQCWSWGFCAFALMMVFALFGSCRAGSESKPGEGSAAAGVGRNSALCWIALSALPSALLIAVTNRITLNVAAMPFLWIIPLALYLSTFILAFWSDWFGRASRLIPLWILAVAGSAFSLLLGGRAAFGLQLVLLLSCLWLGALACHSALANRRPSGRGLTAYYLCISGGGAIGGLFCAIAAPIVLSDYYELPAVILGICVLLPFAAPKGPEAKKRDADRRWLWMSLGFGIAAMSAVLWAEIGGSNENERILDRARGFFGVARVVETRDATYLTIGDIQQGMEFRDRSRRGLPMAYFGPESGVGLVLIRHRSSSVRRIAVLGLGVGTLAAYGRPDDEFRFFEIDPNVERFAGKYFSYLGQSKARVSVKLGDGRLAMTREKGHFDVIVLDAFSSNAAPAHLLTREAFGVYLSKLGPDGILSVNVTNRHLDVARVVQGSANYYGLAIEFVETSPDETRGLKRARFALIARRASTLEPILEGVETGPRVAEPVLWTDNCNALWKLVK